MDMKKTKSNIVLIGMPGSGKSTVGVILAKQLAMRFVDTDILIQTREKTTLQDIVDTSGHMELRKIEEEVLLDITLTHHIIATGGSAAYSEPAMLYLKENGIILFLDASLETLKERITNYEERGLAKRPGQSFQQLFDERYALYRKYADIVVQSSHRTQEEVCQDIYNSLLELESTSL